MTSVAVRFNGARTIRPLATLRVRLSVRFVPVSMAHSPSVLLPQWELDHPYIVASMFQWLTRHRSSCHFGSRRRLRHTCTVSMAH